MKRAITNLVRGLRDLRVTSTPFILTGIAGAGVYAFLQAMGLVNDHAPGCVVRAQVERARGAFQPPVC